MKRALGICVHFLGPTDFRGARVVARCHGRRIVRQWDHAMSSDANYAAAAEAMLARLQDEGRGHGYWMRAELLRVHGEEIRGYVFAVVTPE